MGGVTSSRHLPTCLGKLTLVAFASTSLIQDKLSLLESDLRKIPQPQSKTGARPAVVEFGSQSTTPHVSSTTTSSEAGQAQNLAARTPERQAHDISARNFRRKRRRSFVETPLQQQYWNEYDHPEDSGDEDGFFLYVDQNQETVFDKIWAVVTKSLYTRGAGEQRPLLPTRESETSSREVLESSSDEETTPLTTRLKRTYGAVPIGSTTIKPVDDSQLPKIPRLTVLAMTSSIIILVVAAILAATGRKKLASEVDGGIIFAVSASLAFAIIGTAAMYRQRRSQKWYHWVIVLTMLVFVGTASGGLLAWTIT